MPLVQRSYEMWIELNKRHRTSPDVKELMTECGVLQIGKPDGETIKGVLKSAAEHDLRVEQFTTAQIKQRLPIFKIPDDYVGVYEPEAGFLRVELCVAAAIKQAVKAGAELQTGARIEGWEALPDGRIQVRTSDGDFFGHRLIVAAGAWSQSLLPEVKLNLTVLRKQQHWFQLDRVDQKLANKFPAFAIEDAQGDLFYGLPEIDYLGMKVCKYSGGDPLPSADALDHALNDAELAEVDGFMQEYLDFGRSRLVHHTNCMYSMTADGHFIVDRHPDHANVTFAAGLSGHGFKFAPVLGKYLVGLLAGKEEAEFEFLKLR